MPDPVIVASRVQTVGGDVHAFSVQELAPRALGIIREFVRLATPLRDGYVVELGWGPLVLRARDDGWVVRAPDYAGDPRSEIDDLSLAIWIVVSLTAAASAAGVEPAAISYSDDVIMVKDALVSPMLSMTRTATGTSGNSGWFVEPFPPTGDRDWTPDRLERLPAWRVLGERREVARAFALPVGVSAIIQPGAIRVIVRDDDREVLASGPL